jgi:hypothetical protein
MRTLELFSGTGSVGKLADKYGEVISIDITDKFGYTPTHLADILTWDYKQYPVGHFDFIWASPPCASFSAILNISKDRHWIQNAMDTVGLPLLYRTREIIDYFQPKYYLIENPDNGRMKHYITDLPYQRVSYCRYGYGYRKNTRLWTNVPFNPKLCNHKEKHAISITRTKSSLAERYSIPPPLVQDVLDAIVPRKRIKVAIKLKPTSNNHYLV